VYLELCEGQNTAPQGRTMKEGFQLMKKNVVHLLPAVRWKCQHESVKKEIPTKKEIVPKC
jgi:hypothetical protein